MQRRDEPDGSLRTVKLSSKTLFDQAGYTRTRKRKNVMLSDAGTAPPSLSSQACGFVITPTSSCLGRVWGIWEEATAQDEQVCWGHALPEASALLHVAPRGQKW